MIKQTAEEIYSRLVNDDKIQREKGQIRFYLGNVDIIVRQKDVVGNIIQEWLEGWLEKKGIAFSNNPNTQMPPDLFLNPDDKTTGLLEVKAFNYEAAPGFDIADFKSYQGEIIEKPYMLHTKYLISWKTFWRRSRRPSTTTLIRGRSRRGGGKGWRRATWNFMANGFPSHGGWISGKSMQGRLAGGQGGE